MQIKTKLTIVIEPRPDGGLRVHSPELPGLILSHSDPKLVIADISPALAVLLAWPTSDQAHERGC